MEILTLLRANLRRKKGSFISIVLMTLITVMSVTTILSIQQSTLYGIDSAYELCDIPYLSVHYMAHLLTDDMMEKVRSSDIVDQVTATDAIIAEKAVMGDGEYSHSNTMFLKKDDEDTHILKEDLSAIAPEAPRLQKGEIYVPQGILTNLHGKAGDEITFDTVAGKYTFTVKGVLLDPSLGSSMIGWKVFAISDEDFSRLSADISRAESPDHHGFGKILKIYRTEDCALTSAQFRRQLNLETGITDMALGSSTRELSIHYTSLFPIVISSVLLVFVMLLLAIVVIVTVHGISVEMETDYVTFGVLKAQGFGSGRIRLLFLAQYLSAEVLGAGMGIVLSIPLVKLTSNIFVTNTAIPAVMSVPAGSIALIVAALFVLSAAAIFGVTAKAGRISPVRAISGAKKEIYFDSRLNAPIGKRLLSPSLALRQFTCAKRRYAGTLVIVTGLMFFMTTVTMLANTVSSKSALESMGMIVAEVSVSPRQELSEADFAGIEREIEAFSPIRKACYTNWAYFSFEGEEIFCEVEKDPSVLPPLSGRAPVYENEVSVSPILLDEFNLEIGDEVTIGWQGQKRKFLIVGTAQYMNDTGRCFLMSHEAARTIGYDRWLGGCYTLEGDYDKERNEKIAAALNEKFGGIMEAQAGGGLVDGSIEIAIQAMQMIIYIFSVLFSLIVVHMVCSRAFVLERTDIGIYRAVGFGVSRLRMQFAVRFLIVSLIGSAAGGTMSFFLSGKMVIVLFRSIGITSFRTNAAVSTYAVPIGVLCAAFWAFSWLVSGRVKDVKVRELAAE